MVFSRSNPKNLRPFFALHASQRSSEILEMVCKKFKNTKINTRLNSKEAMMTFLKYAKLAEFEVGKVLQLENERVMGIFVVLSGEVSEHSHKQKLL